MCSPIDVQYAQSRTAPWWRDSVFYQIDVRSFSDSDGDGIGDLAGVGDRLGYLELLGVGALWLTHVFRAPIGKGGNELDPIVGNLDTFDWLISEAHRSGLHVVLDMAVRRDLVACANPTDELAQALQFWMDRGIDGARIGASPGSAEPADTPVRQILEMARPVMNNYPNTMLCALTDDWWFERYGRTGPLDLGIDMRFGKVGFDSEQIRDMMTTILSTADEPDAFPPSWSLEQANRALTVTRFGGDASGRARARAMALVLLALPGVVGLDNGEELGLPNAETVAQTGLRGPILWEGAHPPFGFSTAPGPWTPVTDEWAPLTVEAQLEDESSMLSLYRQAIDIRKNHPAMRGDKVEWYGAPSGCFAFRRNEGSLTCVLNTSGTSVSLPPGELLLSSAPLVGNRLPHDSAAWLV